MPRPQLLHGFAIAALLDGDIGGLDSKRAYLDLRGVGVARKDRQILEFALAFGQIPASLMTT